MSFRRALLAQGGIPPVPTSWAAHAVVAATGSWSPDTAGWYRFYVIGQGGNGGRGRQRHSDIGSLINRAAGGGGGGTGGVAIHLLYLLPGDSVSIAIDDSQTTLSYGGQTVTAIAGSNGENSAASVIAGAGGAGGTASGGNVSNIDGSQGGNGAFKSSGSTTASLSARGGAGGTPTAEMKYVASAASSGAATGAAAPYSTDVSNPQLGGGASGGGARSGSSGYSGGAGAPGGVVIEAGA